MCYLEKWGRIRINMRKIHNRFSVTGQLGKPVHGGLGWRCTERLSAKMDRHLVEITNGRLWDEAMETEEGGRPPAVSVTFRKRDRMTRRQQETAARYPGGLSARSLAWRRRELCEAARAGWKRPDPPAGEIRKRVWIWNGRMDEEFMPDEESLTIPRDRATILYRRVRR